MADKEVTTVGHDFRTTIPSFARKHLEVREGDHVWWKQKGNKIIVEKVQVEVEVAGDGE